MATTTPTPTPPGITREDEHAAFRFYINEAHEALASAWVLSERFGDQALTEALDHALIKVTGPLCWHRIRDRRAP